MPSDETSVDPSDPRLPIQRTTDGKRVIADGRTAPRFMWDFSCRSCGYVIALDAYSGPYTCRSHMGVQPFLEPMPVNDEQMRAWMLAHYQPWVDDRRGERKTTQ